MVGDLFVQKKGIKWEDYPFARFNKKAQLLSYDDDEYNKLLHSEDWTRKQTARPLQSRHSLLTDSLPFHSPCIAFALNLNPAVDLTWKNACRMLSCCWCSASTSTLSSYRTAGRVRGLWMHSRNASTRSNGSYTNRASCRHYPTRTPSSRNPLIGSGRRYVCTWICTHVASVSDLIA